MGRALHVSRSLPAIISSARIIASPNCISSSVENTPYEHTNGEFPQYNQSHYNVGFLPLSTRQSALVQTIMFRVGQNSVGGVLARHFCSGTDFSESEGIETDDEDGTGSGHYVAPCQDRGSHHMSSGYQKQVQQEQRAVFETESDTDVECAASTSQRRMHHGSQKLHYGTESETDVECVASTSQRRMQHGRQKSHYDTESETNTGSETDFERGASTTQRRVQNGRQKLHYKTESETDVESVASTAQRRMQHGRQKSHYETKIEPDEERVSCTSLRMQTVGKEHLQRGRRRCYDSNEELGAEAGSSSSDWQNSDDDNGMQERRQEDNASEVEMAGSDLSEWVETDEDEEVRQHWQEIYESEGDANGASSLSRGRDLSHLKTSTPDRSRTPTRPPERPSKKERSAGLSPRHIRDDDSDDVEIESDLEGELQEEIERQMAAEPKFERPSVTWGILLTRDLRQLAREKVLKYLETEGINISELRRIELPTTVEVMQTRLGFLRKIGLDNEAINNYPLVLGCSVQKNMVPILKYLKKLGFPQPWVPILLKKYPMILHASIIIDILPVIYFLRGLDIDMVDLPRVLTKYPDVLGFKTEGTMSTSVAYLVSMGVKLRHVGHILTEYPEILGMRVASVIKPKFEYLMSLGLPQMIVAKILERRPHLLGYHLENRMQFNVNQLLEVGVRKEALPGMVAQYPELLGRVFTFSVQGHVNWFKDQLRLDSDGVARIFEKMPQAIFMPTEMALERIRFLKSERFTAVEIGAMATQCPQILVSSIKDSLRPNLTFLTKDMKRSRAEVLDFPWFFTYNLRARIRPRFEALTDRDTDCSLDWVLNCSDLEFEKRRASGFAGDEVAGNVFVMGGLLPGKVAKDEVEHQSSEQPKVAAL